jgi:PAS domain S-box-containing protein
MERNSRILDKPTRPEISQLPGHLAGVAAIESLRRAVKEVNDIKFALDASSIVAVTDVKGRITYVNEKFCQISQYSRQELIGKDHRIINSGYHDKEFFRSLWTTIKRGDVWHGEICNRAKNGTLYWVDTFIVPTLDDQGRPSQYIAIRTDITRKKMAENEIIRKNEELLRSNAELDSLAAVAAHDLKSPVNSITQFTELLAERYKGKLDEDADEYFDFIINAGKRMTHLVDSLLQYARFGSIPDRDRKPVPLGEVVDHVRKNLMVELDATGARLSSDRLPTVKGDVDQLTQLFQNLVANAIKYRTPGAAPLIHIAVEEDGAAWKIHVSDNGVGIAENQTRRIFELFKRAHGTTSYEGAGIGLAVVKRIVENHGGTIWVTSEIGKGSTFHFTLPKN